jgi:beta-phosphoglucomutase
MWRMAMSLEAVIFDLDGLLADTERLHYAAWRAVVEQAFGRTVDWNEYADHWIRRGLGIRDYMRRHGLTADAAELLRRKSERYVPLVEALAAPMPGALELLDGLHGRVPLALASSSWQAHVEAVLRKLEARRFFEFVATGDSVPRLKPHPDIFLHTAAALRAAPARCVVLEDAEKGVLAARAAGMAVVAVPTPHTRAHDFSSASFVAASLREVTLGDLDRLVAGGVPEAAEPAAGPCPL